MKIYITRHGKTEWNKERRLQGCQDSPLTDEGIANAKALREVVKDYKLDAIYSSPIKRASDTAHLVFPNREIILDERIQEMNFGKAEGVCIDALPEELKDAYNALWNAPETIEGIEEGETYDSIIKRVTSFLEDITHKDYESVFIVTHGFCFTILMAVMSHLERKDIIKVNRDVVDGCSLTTVEYNGDFNILEVGRNDFLPHQANESYAK